MECAYGQNVFMGRRRLSYDDAVRLLDSESKWTGLLGNIVGAGLASVPAAGPALSLLDLKDNVAQAGQSAIVALRRKLTGLGRFQRSELLEAAHVVLVISAFFTALDDLDAALQTALNSASLELTQDDEVALASGQRDSRRGALAGVVDHLIIPGMIPGLAGDARSTSLIVYYAEMTKDVLHFARGTAAWDQRDETTRDRWSRRIRRDLPGRAVARYEELLRRLAADFPEVAFWANRVGITAILDELYKTREDIAAVLASAARGTTPATVRAELTARYRYELTQPIGRAYDLGPGTVTFLSLRELYVKPACHGMDPHSHSADLWTVMAEQLISTAATTAPLVLFGQPGAGKSVFTQMLAADLDPRDFLVVRVELRAVPCDAGIQHQVEAALHNLTGRSMSWPDLAGEADEAQPVIVLDGFDELLQASGRSHYEYLEKVQEFQEREASLDRPVAVIVTSRTAVANQVRYPDGTIQLWLDEFDDDQVSQWLATWNAANPSRPLSATTALKQRELSRQPLLLFMLALFHSGGGELTPGMSRAELYQRLFTEFVERDVDKRGANESETERNRQVRHDLDQLSMVAFAMLNRDRESVTEAELNADLAAIDRTGHGTDVSKVAGRFFFRLFVQRDQTMQGQQL
jgi:hypothetical protein